VNLEDNAADNCFLTFEVQKLGFWYASRDFSDCWASVQAFQITAGFSHDDSGNLSLCLGGTILNSESESTHASG
ncbi:hypothetical protein M569_05878, partial [Genlisea aurea]